MKKVVFVLFVFVVVFIFVFVVEFGDGIIKFIGEIVDVLCVVFIDFQNQEVVLGQVKKNIFKVIGDKFFFKFFQIKLEDCDIIFNIKVNVSFNGVGDIDDVILVFVNIEVGVVIGVGIGIYDNVNKFVEMNIGKFIIMLVVGQIVLYYIVNYVVIKDIVIIGYGNVEVDFNLFYE